MREYLDIIQRVLDKGKLKHNRTGVDTLTIPSAYFEFDMSKGEYPLLTTRELPQKSIRVELEGFIKGITDKKWYQDRGCHYWDEWCNPQGLMDTLGRTSIGVSGEMVPIDFERNVAISLSQWWNNYKRNNRDSDGKLKMHKKVHTAVDLMKSSDYFKDPDKFFSEEGDLFWLGNKEFEEVYFTKEVDDAFVSKVMRLGQLLLFDLGPIYGFNWRHFGATYRGMNSERTSYDENFTDYSGVGVDQLKNMTDMLAKNPDDRRMLVTSWDPSKLHQMALPPCHYNFQVTVIDGKLNLAWNQRSVDTILGLPSNIASYALLHTQIARESHLEMGTLTGFLVDVQIYANHIEAAKEQVKREPRQLPTIDLPGFTSLYTWDHKQFELKDYNPHPKIENLSIAV